MRSATRPISTTGCRTVVSGGAEDAAAELSSNPTTDRSCGTRSPCRCADARTPSAIESEAANTAVGGSGSSRSSSPIARPASKVCARDRTSASSTCPSPARIMLR